MTAQTEALLHSKGLLKPEEAATYLGIGRSKVFELLADGRLASVRIGRSRRITVAALDDFVARLAEAGEVA
jgi:excisionase family DNA binding protein